METGLRGHIHWHDYGPVTGAELSRNRPALIVTSNLLSQRLTTAITVPTSKSEPRQRFPRQHVWLPTTQRFRPIGAAVIGTASRPGLWWEPNPHR